MPYQLTRLTYVKDNQTDKVQPLAVVSFSPSSVTDILLDLNVDIHTT